MARLIDADTLMEQTVWKCGGDPYDPYYMGYQDALDNVEATIDAQDTVDAVEVVRCKDCKHWHEETGWCNHHSHFVGTEGEACHPWESNDWIPVTEEKPQEFVSVLIYVPGEAPLPTVHEAYLARGCWVTHTAILTEREVTHWMEMPAGPGEAVIHAEEN